MRRGLTAVFLAALTLTVLALPACADKTVYEPFAWAEGFAHFSFDRPQGYELTNKYLTSDPGSQSTQIILTPPSSTQEMGSAITVTAVEPNQLTPDAPTYLDMAELLYKNQKNLTDFRFVQEYSVTVAGVKAEAVLYCYTIKTADGSTAYTVYTRGAYFAAAGLIWAINVGAGTKDGKDNKSVFDRITRTFKILE